MANIIKKCMVGLTVFLLLIGFIPFSAHATDDYLDEIETYTVSVNVRQDGTLDMRYDVKWKVLSDKNGKEPLSWVLIGIPNEHVDQIQALTDNIKTIDYSSSGGGDFVRIDFTQEYYKDSVVDFSFAIHQSYMYILDEEGVCRYGFTPGWFEKIEVKKLHILWNNANVVSSDATHKNEKYLEWYKTEMEAGEHFSINVRYHISTFDVNEEMQYKEKSKDEIGVILLALFIIIVVGVAVLFAIIDDDDYGGGSGFGGGTGIYYHSTSTCARSSTCVSCACACACAGGGRAGCSAKDFYNTDALYKVCTPWYRKLINRFRRK